MKNNFTILTVLCVLFLVEPAIQGEVIHPARVYPTSGSGRYNATAKKKHWWQRKETPQSRAKERAKQQKKRRKARTSKISYDPMWNDPVATSR